jgi:hypothetical protein
MEMSKVTFSKSVTLTSRITFLALMLRSALMERIVSNVEKSKKSQAKNKIWFGARCLKVADLSLKVTPSKSLGQIATKIKESN